jgi:two-component system, NtrC family, sensor kinase
MKLARKLVFGLLLGTIVVLTLSAWIRVAREVEMFNRDTQRDDLLVGRAIATAVARTWKVEGEAAALSLVRTFGATATHVAVRWVWLDDAADGQTAPQISARELATVRAGQELSLRVEPIWAQLTYVPLALGGGRPAALEIGESLEGERAYVRRAVWNAAITTAALVAVAAFLASSLGGYLVGRPVHALVGKVRRIATGDLGGPLTLHRRDELGELANAINQMCEALSGANEAARRATAARLSAVEQLRHADRLTTVGKLASGIAHELGTPLNIVAGRGYMIATKEAEGEEIYENARIIVEQTERITQIIRQLLDFARPRPLEKAPTDLRAVAVQTATLLRPMAEKAGVHLALTDPDVPVVTVADAGQMQQVVTNLVVNAIQACGNGSTVTIGFGQDMVAPPHDEDGPASRYLRVSIKDEGHGMEPEVKARIFDPFFTTKGVGEGTGLGLSIAYGMVRDHRGWIAVDSIPRRGTTVSVYLPVPIEEA